MRRKPARGGRVVGGQRRHADTHLAAPDQKGRRGTFVLELELVVLALRSGGGEQRGGARFVERPEHVEVVAHAGTQVR